MWFIFLLISCFWTKTILAEKSYSGFKVLNVEGCNLPITKEKIENFGLNDKVDYWITEFWPESRLVALVDLDASKDFIKYWSDLGCSLEILTEDVQK